jgi:hypothetical protein
LNAECADPFRERAPSVRIDVFPNVKH